MKKLLLLSCLLMVAPPLMAAEKTAFFAGGCFWCMESDFEKLTGVAEAISGYMGGHTENPTYASTSSGTTGHAETIKVIYDPEQVSYAQLLTHFWRNIDPLTANAQFCDKGSQYRSAIFSDDASELAQARRSKKAIEQQLGEPVVTEIRRAHNFTPAETYHQNYYKKKKLAYNYYRFGCGRDRRLKEIWGNLD